jgi:hypothetical protein
MGKKSSGPSSGILIKAALDYGRLGWSVIPIEARQTGSPIHWQVYQHRHPEKTEIADWFTRWPTANLAIVTGVVSSLVVLDLDPRQGGEASLERLEQEHSPLPETVEAQTGGDGRHLYFGHPGQMIPDRLDLAPGIELRADGGYVVAPPSLHACGNSYRWVRSPDVFHLEPLPAWLARAAARSREVAPDPPEQLQLLLKRGVDEGGRHQAIDALSEHLLRKGLAPGVVLELLLCWNAVRCHPPLDLDSMVHAVERHALAAREGGEPDAHRRQG